ncbi:MAG TPA: hypothetical protein VFU23_07220 [Gemmatimonadales bacterium]|nr:hypothetical protein [Gemmatimonadales bacterium]
MPSSAPRVFLLSPARCDGQRARMLLRPDAAFSLAVRLRSLEGAAIGEVFAFLSGLYFRGKLAYATAFAAPPPRVPPALVITTDRGLVGPEEAVGPDDLRTFAGVDLASADPRFTTPFRRDLERLAAASSPDTQFILLGSIATGKYTDSMLDVLGEQLLFPSDFVGRGDMSRGGLLLRRVDEGRELDYVSVNGAIRRGSRPPRLPRR